MNETDLINLKHTLGTRTATPVARLFMMLCDARITFPAPKTISTAFYGHKIFLNGFLTNQEPSIYSKCYYCIDDVIEVIAKNEARNALSLMEIGENVCRLRVENDTKTARIIIEAIIERTADIETIINRLGTLG